MTKAEYLQRLREHLGNMSEQEKQEILYDYEEHFTIGMANGQREENIISALGDPRIIARQYKAESAIHRAEASSSPSSLIRAVFAALGLGFLNLLFIAAPFLGLVAVIIALYASAAALVISGVVAVLALFLAPSLPGLIHIDFHPAVALFLGTGLTSLGLLCLLGLVKLTGKLGQGTLSYLKLNMRIIKGRRGLNA